VVIGIDCTSSCKSKLSYDHDHDGPFLKETMQYFSTVIINTELQSEKTRHNLRN
jgi:hypothetical protein